MVNRMMTDDEFKIFKAKVARKHSSYVRIKREFQELVQQCTHNEKRSKKEQTSNPLDYDGNTIVETMYDECVLCGQHFNLTSEVKPRNSRAHSANR